jgi:D-alanine-D-alanine ligase
MELLEFTTISRIDGFLTSDGNVIIFDPNSLSGMGPASFLFLQAAQVNMSHGKLINHLIQSELCQYGITTQQEDSLVEHKTITKHSMRIAVLMGGQSHEKAISLESGRNVTYKLSTQKYDITPIFMSSKGELFKIDHTLLVRNSTTEIESLVEQSNKIRWTDLPTIADFVFIALHGGVGENGSVQGTLEMLDMPYNGPSIYASSLCMNKFKTNELLHQHGIPVPRHTLICADEWHKDMQPILDKLCATYIFPFIIKPHDDGCSVMVQKVHTPADIEKAINTIFADGKTAALVEEYIVGTELTVGVLGNENPYALPPSQCVTAADILTMEEKFLPGAGENQTPALLPPHAIALAQETVVNAFVATQCKGYARIDCFYQEATQSSTGKERVVIIEINTLPALTPATCLFHQAAEIGIKPMELLDKIIEYGLELHAKPVDKVIVEQKQQYH